MKLFGEAWDHRRQRHRALAVSLGIAAAAAATLAGLLTDRQASQSVHSVIRHEAYPRLVARTYTSLTPDQQLGAHCAVLNSVACDTLTFQLELRRPALSVVASMGSRGGVKLLETPASEGFPVPEELVLTRPVPRIVFSGELFPMGTAHAIARPRIESGWSNRETNHPRTRLDVRLLITYPDGSRVRTVLPARPLRVYEGGPTPLPLQKIIRASQERALRRLDEHTKSQD